NGGGECDAGRFWTCMLAVEETETEVTTSAQRTHTEFLGQRQRFLVIGCDRLGMRRRVMRGKVAKEVEDPSLGTPFLMSARELEGTLGLDTGLHQAAREEIALDTHGAAER